MEDHKKYTPKVPAGMLMLISGDAFSFIVKEEYAFISTVIETMMKGGFIEARTRVVNLPHIRAFILEKICQYFYYVHRFHNEIKLTAPKTKKSKMANSSTLAFDSFMDSFPPLTPMESVELMAAAQYLDL